MAPHKNDISQLPLFSGVLSWPWISLEAIVTLRSGERGSFWKCSNILYPCLYIERKIIETTFSIKSWKNFVFLLKYGLEKYNMVLFKFCSVQIWLCVSWGLEALLCTWFWLLWNGLTCPKHFFSTGKCSKQKRHPVSAPRWGLPGSLGKMSNFEKFSWVRTRKNFSTGEIRKPTGDDIKIQRGELKNILQWLKRHI